MGILEQIDLAIQWYNNYIGGFAVLLMLIPTGLYFIFKLRFLNVTQLRHSIRIVSGKYDDKKDKGDVNHFKALTTALSATVGTGNIVGVALAIGWGGPGAIFWMWVTGFLGMILKYTECTLSHKYRRFNSDGSVSGGPMYYMEYGLKDKLGRFAKVLAVIFAVAAVFCSLGTGNMAQSNSMSEALLGTYRIDKFISGGVIALLALLVIVGGIKRIAEVTARLVPFMAIVYFLSALLIIAVEYDRIPYAFMVIFRDAFTGQAATGGFFGSAFLMTMLMGVRRGLFSNEAGQGSAAIAHAAARTKWPAREGLVASLEPLVDTIIICTLTALMIILTGVWELDKEGVAMTTKAMEVGLNEIGIFGVGKHIVAGGLMMFAFSTIISWSYYGSRAVNYLFGEKFIKPYGYVYGAFVFLGSIWGLDLVWGFVDMVITFMTIPNLIALLLLAPVVMTETKKYFSEMNRIRESK
jgi:AGCS family alanine or glycine:cation symporter